jgi:hypothetical protein
MPQYSNKWEIIERGILYSARQNDRSFFNYEKSK